MINSNRQINRALGNIKKRLIRIDSQINRDYLNGELDTKIEINNTVIDFTDKLLDLLVLNRGVVRFLDESATLKDVVVDTSELVKNGLSAQEKIKRIMSGDISDIQYFDGCAGEELKLLVKALTVKTEDIISMASLDSINFGVLDLKHGVILDRVWVFNELIWLYVMIKNGYVEELAKDPIINCVGTIEQDMIKGYTFDSFCNWIEKLEVNKELFIAYITTFYSGEITINKLKDFLPLMCKEIYTLYLCEKDSNKKGMADKEAIENERFKVLAEIYTDMPDWVKGLSLIKDYNIECLSGILHIVYDINGEFRVTDITSICEQYQNVITMSLESFDDVVERFKCNEDKQKEQIDRQTKDSEKLKVSGKRYKALSKQAEKELKDIRAQLVTQKNKNEKQVAYINELKAKGINDVQPYKEKIDKLSKILSTKEEEITALKRTSLKLTQSQSELKDANLKLVEQMESAEKEIQKLSSLVASTASTLQGNGIPIECYIEAIKNKKITIFGGDMMHAELKNLGLRNLKLYEASTRTMTLSSMSQQDIIVVITAYMAHSTMHIPKNAAEKYGIPIYYFNNKNVQMLIQELFVVFYGDGYNELKEAVPNIAY